MGRAVPPADEERKPGNLRLRDLERLPLEEGSVGSGARSGKDLGQPEPGIAEPLSRGLHVAHEDRPPERSEVRPLAQFRDLDMMRRIIDAVGAIGGDDARAYLELIASGHEVPAVRDLAAGALACGARISM